MSTGSGTSSRLLKLFSPRISRLARVHRDDAVAVPLQVVADEVARAQLVLRQPDDRDRLRVVEHALDRQRILIARQIEVMRSCRPARRRRGHACEALFQVPDQIVDRFGADREPDGSGTDPCRLQLVVIQLTMRRAGGMDDQALRIADVRQVRPQRDAADEVLPRRASAAAVEGEHRAGAARQVLVDERPVAARRAGPDR